MSSDMFDDFCGSKLWDNALTWETNNPELTPCFEKTYLVWIPCLFLWVLSPLDIFYIFHSKTKNVPWSFLNVTKLLLVVTLILLNAADIVATILESTQGTIFAVDLWTPGIKLVTFIYIFILIFWNKRQGLRTSGIMFLFWFLITVAGIPQFRTEIYHLVDQKNVKFQTFTYIIHFVAVAASLILNLFADSAPTISPYTKTRLICPEVSASFISRLMYSWFDKLAWLGNKRPLTSEDLWSMRLQDSGTVIIRQFSKYYIPAYEKFINKKNSGKKEKKPKSVSVVWPLIRAFLPATSFGLVYRFMGEVCAFISPFILRALVAFVARDEPMWKGYMYAVLLFIVAEAQTIFQTHSMSQMYDLGLRIRTALVSAIYKKSLKTSNTARKGTTVGQIVNLMAVDAQTFFELMPFLNLAWAAPITIGASFLLLYQSVGVAALVGLIVLLVILPFNSFIASLIKKRQIKQMALKDERIKKMNEILSGIKVLKLYAWEPSIQEQILKIRDEELRLLKSAAMLNVSSSFAWASSPFIVSFVTFAVYCYTDESHVLDAQLAFYCLALINIMRIPIAMLPALIQMAIIASVSLKRINKFLSSDELDDNAVSHDQSKVDPLIIDNGTFSWDPEENELPTLKNINMKIKQGDLVAVVGSVGSGKSSLISAFLGEIEKVSGYVNTKGIIAYVGQQAWIQNASLKDNILFGTPLDEKRYNKVVNACALRQDFDMLPGGDYTEIGEKGINLSGGQKQRVSLARAVYADAQIYFLDDPLSAVDAHVGKHIFDNVIGPDGLLKKKTRVLVTHAITYLPQVDMIYVMKDGSIPERGTYRELLAKKQEFADFLMQHISERLESDNKMDLDITEILGTDADLRAKLERQISITASNRSNMSVRNRFRKDSVKSVASTDSAPDLPEVTVPVRADKLIQVEQSETGSVKLSIYRHYFVASGLIFVYLMLFFNFTAQALTIFTNLWLSKWSSDPEAVHNGVQDSGKRDMYIGVYGLIGVIQITATILSSFMLVFGQISASRWLHVKILNNIFHCPMSFFDTTPTGRIVNRFSKDMDTVDTLIPMNCSAFINCFVQVVGILCVISYSTPLFIIVIIPIAVVYFFVQRFYLSTSRQLKRIESVSRSPIFSHFSETVSGATVIRAYGAQQRFIRTSEENVDQNQMSLFPSQISARWLGIRLETVGNLIIFFAALFAVLNRDSMDPGIAGVSINYALQVTLVLNFCVRMTSDLEANIVAVERIKEYSEIDQEAPWYTNKKPDSSWPEKGKVEFRNYQVRYREGLELVLKGISFTVNGGEKIGIVGRTGAGKSSLTLCLFRILEAAGGSILIDGLDISKIGLNDLRSRLTIIPQDPVLFSGTLRVNLDPAGQHSDEAIWESLALSHLSGFVKTLPKGLDYEITEGGDNLSLGQSQLLCLARALLRKTKVLIMDEATAAVDLDTDDLIQRTIRTEFKDCTVLTIAHRLNTIMDSDRVVVLDKGLLKEFDSPANLLKDKSSIFFGMAQDAGLVS